MRLAEEDAQIEQGFEAYAELDAEAESKKRMEKEMAKNKRKAVSSISNFFKHLYCRKFTYWSPEDVTPITVALRTLDHVVVPSVATSTSLLLPALATISNGRL